MNKINIHKYNLKKSGFVLTLLAASLASTAFADVNDTIEKTFDFDRNGRIQLSNVNGDVTISACDCSKVTLTANISTSSQKARDRISIEIEDSSSALSIKTKYKNNDNNSWNNERSEVTYTLSVPDDVRLDGIELVNGSLEIKGVTGELEAKLVNGNLKSDGLTSSTRVEMVNGDMDIRYTNFDKAKAINLESVNGDIELSLPAGANATVKAETVSGQISNEFGMEVIKHKYVGSEMHGTIGNGDIKIALENVNGRIVVNSI